MIGTNYIFGVKYKAAQPPGVYPLNGLVAAYPLNEKPGALYAVDVVSSENMTISYDIPVLLGAEGKHGTSYEWENNLQNIGTTAATSITGNFSINVWIYRNGSNTNNSNVAQQGAYSDNTGFGIWISSAFQLTWRINQTFNNYKGTVIPLNTWVMVTLTWDGSTARMYQNGILDYSDARTIAPNPSTKRRIMNRDTLNGAWRGRIDSLMFYNRALNATEITGLFNNGEGQPIQ